MKYRPEIDGLRTVAVMPVILFHAGFETFRGGFVGVDVFFVISGYLITTILLGELARGDFSITRFYERRARRILPALFFVMAITLPFAWAWLTPSTFDDYGRSVVATVLFGSNILFWRSQGYFANDAELTPLLHTWSLAVEEQYYIFFPILLLLLWRFGRRAAFWVLAGIAALSLGLSEIGWRSAPTANFYLIPTRAWELFAGSLCAFLAAAGRVRPNTVASTLGLALIVYAILFFDSTTPMPSLWAAIPVGGAVLIILFGGAGSWVARLLSLPPFVAIGLISYSAYLWHQPIFAFARIRVSVSPDPVLLGALAGLSLLLAWLTWRFVERPFRGHPAPVLPTRAGIFGASLAAGLVFIAIGVGAVRGPTYQEMTSPELFARAEGTAATARPCPDFDPGLGAICRMFGAGPRHVVVWGDSHAAALGDGLPEPPADMTVTVLSHLGCPPVLNVWRIDGIGTARNCSGPAQMAAHQAYIDARAPDAVVIMARWTLYQRGWWRHGHPEAATHFLTDGNPPAGAVDAASSAAALEAGLRATIASLADVPRLVVTGQPAELNFLTDYDRLRLAHIPASGVADWHAPEQALLTSLATEGVTVVSARDLFCDAAACALRRDGAYLYSDDNHLSGYAAGLFWAEILAAL